MQNASSYASAAKTSSVTDKENAPSQKMQSKKALVRENCPQFFSGSNGASSAAPELKRSRTESMEEEMLGDSRCY
jgi:hypothetical protein